MGFIDAVSVQKLKTAWKQLFQKYWIPVALLCLGLMLSCIPFGKKQSEEKEIIAEETIFSLSQTQTQMECILSSIDGAGSLKLMLTLSTGVQSQYLQDTRQTTSEGALERESETVFSSEGSSVKRPIETMQYLPKYQGALVVCEGADSAKVRLAVKEAISSLTGLGSDKITVVKMKG